MANKASTKIVITQYYKIGNDIYAPIQYIPLVLVASKN
jgi:hypothetical protein